MSYRPGRAMSCVLFATALVMGTGAAEPIDWNLTALEVAAAGAPRSR